MGIMKSITVTTLLLYFLFDSSQAAGYPSSMQITVFSSATSTDTAKVESASLSLKNLVMLEKVKCPLPSWKAYTSTSSSGITTNTTIKIT